MNPETLPSLQISLSCYQRGHFAEAKIACDVAIEEAKQKSLTAQWLEALRIRIQCLLELDLAYEENPYQGQILKFLQENQDLFHACTAEYILGLLFLGRGSTKEAQFYFESALSKATQSENHRTLAYALFAEAILAASGSQKNLEKASANLSKIDLIASHEKLDDLLASAGLLRCYLLSEWGRFDEALHLLWKSYEHAKAKGLNLILASVLAEMSQIHRTQNRPDVARIYAELALCGVSSTAQPRLYRRILQLCPKTSERYQHDIEVDEKNRTVLERKKGPITFGNQHLLLEMALLFMKNPGQRYSKTDLIEKIWRQNYAPTMHDNLIYVSIKRLRVLLEPSENPHYLLKDREGYYFNPSSTVLFKTTEASQ